VTIVPEADGVHKSLRDWPYRKVFLTGATGLIGGQILHDMLQLPQIDEISCLVRPSSGQSGIDRLAKRLRKAGIKKEKLDQALKRVRTVEGEITEKLWQIPPKELDRLRDLTELFVHCAASTSFVDEGSCESINVNGTKYMLDVVEGTRSLQRLVHFSTATLCGYLPNRIVTEDESPNPKHKHVVAYTRTKAEGERILWQAADLLPLLVLRPSITMAQGSQDPKQARLFLWSAAVMVQLPFVPVKAGSLIDIVTLDFVVQSTMRLIARGDRLTHKCYHLTAGKEAAVSAGEIRDAACAAAEVEGPEFINPDDWDETYEQTIEEQGLRSMYEALLYLPFINLNLIYDKTRLVQELGDDLPHLPKFTEYIGRMLHTMAPDKISLDNLQAFGL